MSLLRPLAAAALVCTAFSACITNPNNATPFAGPTGNKPIPFQGFYPKPSIPIRIEVLKEAGLDTSDSANWALLATTSTVTTPTPFNGDNLYEFSATVTPVTAGAGQKRWPNGKLVRLRAVALDPDEGTRVLNSFDDATWEECLADNFSEPWSVVGTNCASPFSPLALVSTQNNPANGALHDYLGARGDLIPLQTTQYYLSIQAPSTLAGFKSKYGFPGGETVAKYYNAADLGFGREMHCRTWPTTYGPAVACYVKNFGNVANTAAFPANQTSALNLMATGHGQFATVAMVYTPPNGDNAIKFFVYGKESDGDPLVTTAQLDSTGEHVSIPNNCMSCHGINSQVKFSSNPLPNTPVVSSGARFLPFDMYSFGYSGSTGSLSSQQVKFETLNALVALTPMTAATQEFLKGLYGGVMPGAAGATPTDRFIPVGWSGSKEDVSVHEGVYKHYCRTCHVSATSSSLDFNVASEFASAPGVACNPNHRMPHAEHTLRQFWNSGARAIMSQRYGLAGSGDCSQ